MKAVRPTLFAEERNLPDGMQYREEIISAGEEQALAAFSDVGKTSEQANCSCAAGSRDGQNGRQTGMFIWLSPQLRPKPGVPAGAAGN